MMSFGFARLMKGFRTSDPALIALGGLVVLIAWLRRPPSRTLLYSERMDIDEKVVVEMKRRS